MLLFAPSLLIIRGFVLLSLPHELLLLAEQGPWFLGFDVGKRKSFVCLVTPALNSYFDSKYPGVDNAYTKWPYFTFEMSRQGFDSLLALFSHIKLNPKKLHITLESTGSYSRPVVNLFRSLDAAIFLTHVRKRPRGSKLDHLDAKRLTNELFNSVYLGAKPSQTNLTIRELPLFPIYVHSLQALLSERRELMYQTRRLSQHLRLIQEELHYELTLLFADPNIATALSFREAFPSASRINSASREDLRAALGRRHLTDEQLQQLQTLAKSSISTPPPEREIFLIREQQRLIKLLRDFRTELAKIDKDLAEIVYRERATKIACSIPGFGVVTAATVIAAIGSIRRFPTPAKLQTYLGWGLVEVESSDKRRRRTINRESNRRLASAIFLAVLSAAVREGGPLHARFTESVQARSSSNNLSVNVIRKQVIGGICGHLIRVLYYLLKADEEMIATYSKGQELPPPKLYENR